MDWEGLVLGVAPVSFPRPCCQGVALKADHLRHVLVGRPNVHCPWGECRAQVARVEDVDEGP